MIRSAITVSLVPEARGGPFVFWDGLDAGIQRAAELGFDAVEVFPPSADELHGLELRNLLRKHNLQLAAVGTGAGWVKRKLTLTDPDPHVRMAARDFAAAIIDFAAGHGAPAIIGSMQGRWGGNVSREQALDWLREELDQLAPRALAFGVPLLIEPLNRYETNLLNTVDDGLALFAQLRTRNVKLLCDLYHMNIEEADIAGALRKAGDRVGHVHFADSNRRAIGFGHTDVGPVRDTLQAIGYAGYVSAEVLPLPNSEAAAEQTMVAYRKWFHPRSA